MTLEVAEGWSSSHMEQLASLSAESPVKARVQNPPIRPLSVGQTHIINLGKSE